MLETSSTKSVEPRKGVVGVGSGGSNRAEPVGKHEVVLAFRCSPNFYQLSIQDFSKITTPPISRLITSSSTDLLASAAQIVVEYNRVDDGGGCNSDFDMTFQVTRWRLRQYSPTRTIDFNCTTIDNRYLLPWIEVLSSWSKCQFRQEVHFLRYIVSSHVMLTFRVHPALTSPWCSGWAYQRIHQLARSRLWLSLMSLMLVVVVVASQSKICQKVGELLKSPKSVKGLKSL